jgi:hypothetical protein
MDDEKRIEMDKHFDAILNILEGENEERLNAGFDAVKEAGEIVSKILDDIDFDER